MSFLRERAEADEKEEDGILQSTRKYKRVRKSVKGVELCKKAPRFAEIDPKRGGMDEVGGGDNAT